MWPLLPTEAAAQETTAHTAPAPAVDAHLLHDGGAAVGSVGGVLGLLIALDYYGFIRLPRRGQESDRNDTEIAAISAAVDAIRAEMGTMRETSAKHEGILQLHTYQHSETRKQLGEVQEDVRAARDDTRRAVDLLASRS